MEYYVIARDSLNKYSIYTKRFYEKQKAFADAEKTLAELHKRYRKMNPLKVQVVDWNTKVLKIVWFENNKMVNAEYC